MTNKKMTFLVTGGGGYLGSVIVPMLLKQGYQVRVLDRFFWGKDILKPHITNSNLALIEADSRYYSKYHLKDVDIVIDLAALSNDPTAEINPQNTIDINYYARVRTALMSKKMGVKRYILASSCTVYGLQDGIVNEDSKTAPVTTYAKASLLAEHGVLRLLGNNFTVTVLRQGTLYGVSPRMRFDLALNTMTLSLFNNNAITIQGGEQWRPIVHVEDSANAFIKIAQSNSRKVNGQVFNVGVSEQNYQIKDLAQLIASKLNPSCKIIFSKNQPDVRSYQVSFEKIKNEIGYLAKKSPEIGAEEVYAALMGKKVSDTMQTKTIEWYNHLLSKNPQILNVKKP